MKRNLPQQLTLYLNEHGVLESKGISVESYEIKYMFPKVVEQAYLYRDCGVWVCIFLYKLSRNLPLTVKDPLQTALAYREWILQYFWRHKTEAEPSVLPDEDYIPFEMQIEIMNRLPVKSLLQFRTVSKSWKSCIDSSTFFFNYGVLEAATGHIMGHTVQVYMENSQSFENVTIQGNVGSFFVGAYKESLILAAYPNHSLHCAG
ncbi:phospholipase-like protein [Tanacetum coccineum]